MNSRIAEIDRTIIKISAINVPAMLLVGLGLLGKYGEPDEIASFPFLQDQALVTGMLLIGVPMMVGLGIVMLRLALEKLKIQRSSGAG